MALGGFGFSPLIYSTSDLRILSIESSRRWEHPGDPFGRSDLGGTEFGTGQAGNGSACESLLLRFRFPIDRSP